VRTSAATLYNRSARATLEATVAAAEAELRACRQENLAVAAGWDVASPLRPRGDRTHNRSSFSRGIGRSEETTRKMYRFRALINTRAASIKAGGQVCVCVFQDVFPPLDEIQIIVFRIFIFLSRSRSLLAFVFFYVDIVSFYFLIASVFFSSTHIPVHLLPHKPNALKVEVRGVKHSIDSLREQFNRFASVATGAIDADDLLLALEALGEKGVTLAEAEAMVASVDRDGNGNLDLEEFIFLVNHGGAGSGPLDRCP